MTIMTETHGDRKTRRCDGTCHHARKPKCTCICGGRYHGKGNMAQECLTRDWLGDDWREKKALIEAAGGSLEAVVTGAIQRVMAERAAAETTIATSKETA